MAYTSPWLPGKGSFTKSQPVNPEIVLYTEPGTSKAVGSQNKKAGKAYDDEKVQRLFDEAEKYLRLSLRVWWRYSFH